MEGSTFCFISGWMLGFSDQSFLTLVVEPPDGLNAHRKEEAIAARLDKRKRRKDLGLLSFGEEAGEEESHPASGKSVRLKSIFDAQPQRSAPHMQPTSFGIIWTEEPALPNPGDDE